MAVQWNSDTGLSGWVVDIYKAKKGIVDVSDEVSKFFTKYQRTGKDLSTTISNVFNAQGNKGINNFAKQMGIADETLVNFLSDTNYVTKDLTTFKIYLEDTGKATTGFSKSISAVSSAAKSMLATMASMAVMWAIGEAISYAVKGVNELNDSCQDNREKFESLSETYASNKTKLEEINTTLEDNKKKILEINELTNPTYTDEEELNKLKQENALLQQRKEILERTQEGIANKADKALEQQFNDEFVTKNSKYEDAGKLSWKSFATLGLYNVKKTADTQEQSTGYEKGKDAIKKLEELQKLKDKLLSANENDDFVKGLEKKIGAKDITEVIDEADKEINNNKGKLEDYYSTISEYIDKLKETDPNLESSFAKQLISLQDQAYKYINPDEWQKSAITNILDNTDLTDSISSIKDKIKKGLSYEDLITDEDSKNIVKGIAMKIYDNASDESMKKAASQLYKALSEGLNESVTGDTLVSFDVGFNNLGDTKDKLLELSAAGELTPETLSSTEEYNKLLTDTGLSADEAMKKIDGLVTSTQKLSAVTDGLSSLTDLYKQSNENGFVDIGDLDGMSDVYKNLDSYNNFVNTLSTDTSSLEERQSAFDQLTKEYLIQTDALSKLDETNKNTYITQLKSNGVANAQEVVETMLNDKLRTRENTLSDLGMTQEAFNALSYESQNALLDQATAGDTCRGSMVELQMAEIAYNKNGLDVTGKIESLKNLAIAYGIANDAATQMVDRQNAMDAYEKRTGAVTGFQYTEADYKHAEDDLRNQIAAKFSGLDNVTTAYNGGTDYQKSIEKAADNASSSAKESSSKVFDFIETRLSRLERRIKLFANKITDYTSSAIKKRLIENSIGAIGEKINAEIESLGVYMNKADSVNLDEYWKSQIRDGSLNIADIQDDDLSQAISDYQSWYEKALSCEEEIDSLKTSQLDKVKELSELQAKMFQNGMDYIDYAKEYKESMMSINDTNGKWNNAEDYQAIINLDNQKLDLLAKQNSEYAKYQFTLDNTSDAWQDVQEKIQNNVKSYNDILNDIAQKVKEIEELPIKKLQVWLDYYDSVTSEYKSKSELKSNKSDLSINDYRSQMNVNSESIAAQTKQMESYYWEYLRAGALGNKQAQLEYAQKYHEAQNAITQFKLANEELKKSLRDDVYWRNFERAHTSAQSLANILKGLSSLIDENSLFNKDTGGFTDSGRNKIALTVKQYETAKKEVSNYMKDIKNLETLYRSGFYSSNEYNEKLKELQQSLIDSTNDVKSYSDALVELTINQGQQEIDILKETIEARKDALNKKKEYYDYDKTIRSKTKDIQSLETQKAALLATEDTLEKRKKLLEIEEELQSKRDDLTDTQTEHEINLVVNGLDDFVNDVQTTYDDYSDKLKSSLEMQTEIINDANKMYAESYNSIKEQINNLLKSYGVDVSLSSNANFSGLVGFASGGSVAGQIRKNGDSLLASVNPGETILTQDFTKMLPDLVGTMKDFVNIDVPNYSNFTSAKTPIVNINYDGNLVNVEGSATTSTIDELKQLTPQIAKEVTKSITQDLKKNGFK